MGSIDFFTILFILLFSATSAPLTIQGRGMFRISSPSKASSDSDAEEKAIVMIRIGSTPPRCERKCSSCGRCEAIQVPTNPQEMKKSDKRQRQSNVSGGFFTADQKDYYSRGRDRGDYSSNYKPLSWKCKCGKFIFNP